MKKIKDQKIRCACGCPMTLYIADFIDGQLAIGVEENARKSFKSFKGIIIDRKELKKILLVSFKP